MIKVLYIDKMGQVSSELMAILNIILRKIRNSNTYIEGLHIIGNMHPDRINRRSLLTSQYVLLSFEFITIQYSMRTSGGPGFQ